MVETSLIWKWVISEVSGISKARGKENVHKHYTWVDKDTFIMDCKTQSLFIKKLCIYSYIFKLQWPPKYTPFDAIHPSRLLSTAQNSFWTHQCWCLLMILPFFVSPLSHWQNISLWGLFSFRKRNRNSHLGQDWVNREGGTRGHAIFGQKLLNT